MKLRCTNNSIRLRLRKSDIGELAKNQKISETVFFGNNTSFYYTLVLADIDKLKAKFSNNNIFIIIPKNEGESWINSDQVGIDKSIELENNESLHILIEKDFPCLDRDHEDKSDTFEELAHKSDNC